MSTGTKLPPPLATNGVITAAPAAKAAGNRKKQKRRAKQAAKVASQVPMPLPQAGAQSTKVNYNEDTLHFEEEDEDEDFSDAEPEQYDDQYQDHVHANGIDPAAPLAGKKRNKKKKGSVSQHQHHHHHHHGTYDPHLLPPLPHHAPHSGPIRPPARGSHSHGHSHSHDNNIWNTSSQQERSNIKKFWLTLNEDERRSLLKIEKEAVLKKMKQQQKHSCSCTVCGRKRTAIEEELEQLYEGYYEELEQYAHTDNPPLSTTDGLAPAPLRHPLATSPPPQLPHHKTSNLHEHFDDDEFSEEEEEYSDEDDEEDYSDEDPDPGPLPHRGHEPVPDFLNFGSHLTVKGILTPWVEKLKAGLKGNADNLLTVADDLLKNDGRKFIEMMEQLAERRMQRENRSLYEAENHVGYPQGDHSYDNGDPLPEGDEYDDEDSYDSQEEYDDDMDEEDDMGGLTEEQRMQEGRRMFQIFAARMFEQRVLTAYREKVAAERQRKLLEELDDEDQLKAQREAKKQRDAQKKKEKKKQQQQAKAEDKAKKDAEKAEEESRLREAEEKKLEEQRRKKEEQKKKREEEKRKSEEEKARKESEKLRRQQEEQQRREEAERKAREQKAVEKARKDEMRKKEREERDAREKNARGRKAQDDEEKREREAKARAEREVKDREKTSQQAAHAYSQPHPPQITKRPSQAGMVAIPGVYPKQTHSGISSPHPHIATPAIPKAPTPAKQRQASHQGSHASSPKQSQSQLSSAPSKSSSPGSTGQQQAPIQPRTIMQKPNHQQVSQQHQHPMPTPSPLHQHSMPPPPGMPHPQQHIGGFGGMPPMGYPGFQGPHGPMPPTMGQRGQMPMFPRQGAPPMGLPNRMPFGGPGMNGMAPPPGMMMPPQGRGFAFEGPGLGQPPPGFAQQPSHIPHHTSPIGQVPNEPQRQGVGGHSRQLSSDKERFEYAANQPIARPAPIQRPSSVKPPGPDRPGSNPDMDDLSKHLGSSALLDDTDEPLPTNATDARRQSNNPPGARNIALAGPGPTSIGGFGAPGGFATPGSSWNTPAMPFGQSPGGLGQPGWGSLPAPGLNTWSNSNAAFGANGFGGIGPGQMHRGPSAGLNRPLTIRVAVCQACKQLSNAVRGDGDGFHNVDVLLRQIEANRPMLDFAPTLREIEEICETEGDSQNGGGELSVRRYEGDTSFAVKWEADASTPEQGRGHTGLGEIGSPMPSKPSLAIGFGAPGMGRAPGMFANLGAVGSPNN